MSDAVDRRDFLQRIGISAAMLASGTCSWLDASPVAAQQPPVNQTPRAAPRGNEFVFARLRYESGDWDYNPKVCANVLDAVVQYTGIPVQQQEVVITADSAELPSYPFLFMTGHKLVRFSERERRGLVRYVENGGLLFSDDCNHDVNGLYAKSFESEMHKTFGAGDVLGKIPKTHPLFRSFFTFDGPPQTSHELNGWGDNIVHGYLRGVERRGRLGVVYSNQDYGCEWDYSWKNKKYRTKDNTRFVVNMIVYTMT
jgi:hypothetical protein